MRQRKKDNRGNKFQLTAYSVALAQNVWGTVLDLEQAGEIIQIGYGVLTANETLELEVTLDGTLIPVQALPATFNSDYDAFLSIDVSQERFELSGIASNAQNRKLELPFKISCLIRVRKTTVAGAGKIVVNVAHVLLL